MTHDVSSLQYFSDHYDILYISSDLLLHKDIIGTGAGGLGVVAGSIASELEHNFSRHQTSALFAGFYCTHGYQKQVVRHGVMEPTYEYDPRPDTTRDTGKRFTLILAGRECRVAIRTPTVLGTEHTGVILLDTDIDENPHDFRLITRSLYIEKHGTAHWNNGEPWADINWMRVLQSAVLGIGAYYAVRELGISVRLVHLNDSHPVFYAVHQLGRGMHAGMSYEHALEEVRKAIRYTNHTVLESGNKRYSIGQITSVCGHYRGFDEETLRRITQDDQTFKMTTAALELVGPGHANAVSRDHARLASQNFNYEFFAITNGVYVPEYQHEAFKNLRDPHDIPRVKREVKRDVLAALRVRAEEAGWHYNNVHTEDMMNSVLLGFARRGQSYKRPGLMWHHAEFDFVKKLLEWRHIGVAWGGLIHPDDVDMHRDWNKYWRRIRDLSNVATVFNYRLDLMQGGLKAASDIWLNTPWYGYEACGTSWMSAMMNCSIVVSIPDGGVLEAAHLERFGSDKLGDWHVQYEYDAAELWQKLYCLVCELRGQSPRVLEYVYNAKLEAEEQFSATRMVDEYRKLLWI